MDCREITCGKHATKALWVEWEGQQGALAYCSEHADAPGFSGEVIEVHTLQNADESASAPKKRGKQPDHPSNR